MDTAKLQLDVDTSRLSRATEELNRFRQAGAGAQGAASGIRTETDKASSSFAHFASNTAGAAGGALANVNARMLALGTAAGVAGGAIGLLTTTVAKSTQAFKELELEQATYTAVLRASGMAAGKTADDIEDLAVSIRRMSTQTEGDVRQAAAVLLTFQNVTGDAFDKTLRLAADLSAVMGTSMAGAAQQLGRAMEDPERGMLALRRAGIVFSESQQQVVRRLLESGQAAKATEFLIESLTSRIGGAAGARGDTLTGSLNQFSEAVNNWMERQGKPWADLLSRIARTAGDVIDQHNKMKESQESAASRFEELNKKITANPFGTIKFGFQQLFGINTPLPRVDITTRSQMERERDEKVAELWMKDQQQMAAEYGKMQTAARSLSGAYTGVTTALDEQIDALKRTNFEQMVHNELIKVGKDRTEEETRAMRDGIAARIAQREQLEFMKKQQEELVTSRMTTGAEIMTMGRSVGEQEAARREAEMFAQHIRDGKPITAELAAEIRQLALAHGELEQSRARARIASDIQYEQRLLGLTEQQVALVTRLKELYGNDIPAAMRSAEFASMKFTDDVKRGQEAVTGLFTGLSSELRTSKDIGQTLLNRAFRFGDQIIDAQFKAMFSQMAGTDFGKSIFGGIGGMLNPGIKPTGGPTDPIYVAPALTGLSGVSSQGLGMPWGTGVPWGRGSGGGSPWGGMLPWGSGAGVPFLSAGDRSRIVGDNPLTPAGTGIPEGWTGTAGMGRGFMPPGVGFPFSTSGLSGATDISGAVTRGGLSRAFSVASQFTGMTETANRVELNSFLKSSGINLDVASNKWCAAFVNASLDKIGIKGTGSNVATSFANWGTGIDPSAATKGDILVEMRGLQPGQLGGHVGLATGEQRFNNGQLQLGMLSGNQGNAVTQTWVNSNQVLARTATQTSTEMTAAAQSTSEMANATRAATGGLGQFNQVISSIGGSGGFPGVGGMGGMLNPGNWNNFWGGSPFAGGGEIYVPTGHSGGVVGSLPGGRWVNRSAFAGARRYRRGGLIGLAPDEVPIVGHLGEEMITDADWRHRRNIGRRTGRDNGGRSNVSASIRIETPSPREFMNSQGQVSRVVARGIERSRKRFS